MKRAWIAAVLCVWSLAAQQKGSISGKVVSAATGDPLRKVTLTLTRPGEKGEPATAQPDDGGRFAFRDLEAGSYRLSGERTGYQKQAYGAKLDPSRGTPLRVNAGQAIENLVFKLTPNAVIGGRVIDEAGEPMPNLMVGVLRRTYERGALKWTQMGAAQTNDRGEYRIGNLRAGRYLVSASDLNVGIGLAGVDKDPLPDKPEPGYGTTYFGNTTEIARAAAIEVAAGEDRRGADIQMVKTATMRIRGRVIGAADDKPLVILVVGRGTAEGNGTARGVGVVQGKEGMFEIRALTAGPYMLMVRSATDLTGAVSASVPLELTDRHLDGVELRLGASGDLAGSVSMPGGKPEKDIRVRLEIIDVPMMDQPSATADADGSFTLRSVMAGKYRVRVEDLPDGAYVRTVKVGGQEVNPDGAELQGGAGKLEIAVSRSGAKVEGTVVGAGDQPMPGAMVALIPEPRAEWRYRTASADHDGTFELKGVAPGKYKILAWEEIESGAWQDPEFVKPFDGQAVALTIEDNGKPKLTLKGIPFEGAR